MHGQARLSRFSEMLPFQRRILTAKQRSLLSVCNGQAAGFQLRLERSHMFLFGRVA